MLVGNVMIIRPIGEADLGELAQLMGDINKQGDFLPVEMVSEAHLRRDYATHGFVREGAERYVIVAREGDILGLIWAFSSIPYFDALEVGYQIFDSNNRGKGYVSEALPLFCDYLFRAKKINRLDIRIATANTASLSVAKKAGFELEGTCRQAAFSQGEWLDMHILGLLRQDWQRVHQASLGQGK